MCCRLTVRPLNPEIASELLRIGLFIPTFTAPNSLYPTGWERKIVAEGTAVQAVLHPDDFNLSLNLLPPVSSYPDHARHRLAAGCYFEMAARIAERVDGEIIQQATVVGCKAADGSLERLIASYPSQPLDFSKVCNGFRELFLNTGEKA